MSEVRYSGHWVVASQGLGKSNLLLHMLSDDLEEDASVIIIDPKGDLCTALKVVNLGDRFICLDPAAVPFAINPLDVPKTDTKRAVDQIEYIFCAILGAGVTPKQQALLRSLLRACITGIPHATLLTVEDLLIRGPEPYRSYIKALPNDLQHLFDTSKAGGWATYETTRHELKWRLQLLLEIDLIRTMFTAPKTRFKIGDAMNEGKVVLIDNSWDKLHLEGSKFLGRYIMAQIWAAATARSSKPRHEKKPVYVYVDEADAIIDGTVAEIIYRCRSQNIALILAHQSSSQIKDPNVLSALENCAIKMANVDPEAKYFSKLLHIPEERMNRLPIGHFALHVRGEEPSIVSVPLAELPYQKLTADEQRSHQERMQRLYGVETHESPIEPMPLRGTINAPAENTNKAPTRQAGPPNVSPPDDPSKPVAWSRK